MDSSMESGMNILGMGIFIKENMWTDFLKGLDSTSGVMVVCTKEISNKG